MNSNNFSHIALAVRAIFAVAGNSINTASETENEFTLNIPVLVSENISTICKIIEPYLDIASVKINFDFQQISAKLSYLKDGRLKCAHWNEDIDLSPSQISDEASVIYQQLKEDLSEKNLEISLDDFNQRLNILSKSKAPFTISIYIYIDKRALVKSIEVPVDTNCIIFFLAEKLKIILDDKFFSELDYLWNPDKCCRQIILLGNANGKAESAWLKIIGLDLWGGDFFPDLDAKNYQLKVREAQDFRKEETDWEFAKSNLTPHLFYTNNSSLIPSNIFDATQSLCAQACISFLSNRVSKANEKYIAEFHGYKKSNVDLVPSNHHKLLANKIFELFLWSYENNSSDKLSITRQIISYQLGNDLTDNRDLLLVRSSDLLLSAKNNFQYYLLKNVEAYFEKRLKVVEFMQKFTDEISIIITKISSDFIGDLYKTIGTILGVVVASLLSPPSSVIIIFWTSILYFTYILILSVYLLPMSFIRYRNSTKMFDNNFSGLSAIMMRDELDNLKQGPYNDAVWTFRFYFFLTNSAYAVLGIIALIISNQLRIVF